MLRAIIVSLAGILTSVQAEDFLLVSDWKDGIYRVDVKYGTKSRLAFPHSSTPLGLAYDPILARVIWFEYSDKLIRSAHFDGSDFKIHFSSSEDSTRHMVYHASSKQLFYVNYRNISKSNFDGSKKSMLALSSPHQIAVHRQTRTIFYADPNEHQVWSMSEHGTEKKVIFSVASDVNMRGLTLDPQGKTLYACGYTTANGIDTSHYYKYETITGVMSSLGSREGVRCRCLATDGHSIFLADDKNLKLLVAPVQSPAAAHVLSGPWVDHINDIEYVKVPQDCTKRRSQSKSVRIADSTAGGQEVASYPISARTRCFLTGDTDAAANFDARTINASCHVFLKPGNRLDPRMKRTYNLTLASTGSCPWITPEQASVTVEVYQTGCQPLPESIAPGDVVFEVPIGYHTQAKPLHVVLHGDGQDTDDLFALRNPVLTAHPNGTAQIVVKRTVDYDKAANAFRYVSLEFKYCFEITDINDNAPEFVFPDKGHRVMWKEGLKGDLFQAKAKDADEGKFGTDGLRFFVVYEPTGGKFFIDSTTGILSTIQELDRESTYGDIVSVVIEVRDNEGVPPFKKTITAVQIKVGDINDNKPIFSQAQYKTDIPEVVGKGNFVLHIKASDQDEGPNAEIEYSLASSGPAALFAIDPKTGIIRVSGSLWSRVGSHRLTVNATDRGTPPLSSSAIVIVNVQSLSSLSGRKRRQALRQARVATARVKKTCCVPCK